MQKFRLIAKLVLSQMRLSPARPLLTILGIVASTCAVVWVVSGYDALVGQFDENSQKYLGKYDLLILPVTPPGTVKIIDDDLLNSLKSDVGVMELNPVNQTRVSVTEVLDEDDSPQKEDALTLLVGSKPPVYGAPPIDPVLVSTPANSPPYELVDGKWFHQESERAEAVLGVGAAKQIGVGVGDKVLVTTIANQVELLVVGLVEQAGDAPSLSSHNPGAAKPKETEDSAELPVESESESKVGIPPPYVDGPAVNAVYVRPEIAAQINGFPAHANVLQIALREGVSVDEFKSVWTSRLEASDPPLRIVDYSDVRQGMESTWTTSSLKAQAWTATGMASVAAAFIIFTTLSMGVSEQTQRLAMLRAIAFTRSQVAALIVVESVTLATLGWLCGIAAGWLLLTSRQLLFSEQVALGFSCVLLSAITVFVGAFAAAIIPAWRALRVSPLAGLRKSIHAPPIRLLTWIGGLGLLLSAAAPISVFLLPLPDDWRVWIYSTVSWPALFVGMILLCPITVVVGESIFGWLLCRLLRLDPGMVRMQLSSNLWRSVGASLALSLGLGLFISTQTWGHSMLQQFMPGDWLPDALVGFHPIGLDDEKAELVLNAEGVNSQEVMPLAIEQAPFVWPDSKGPEELQYDNAVLFGVDPGLAFADEASMLKVDFVIGDRQQVIEELKKGDACLISQDFQMLTDIGVGDELSFTPPNAETETKTYRVVGVVAIPGWQWVTKFSGVRKHFVRTATMIFVSRDSVVEGFHLPRTEFFWFNKQPTASMSDIESALQEIAMGDSGVSFQSENYGEVTAYRPFARVTATETVRRAITMTGDATIREMSRLPLVTLLIMSLAVANAMVASVRARTWEMGVLRSVGLTRWQLVRLILVEAILIGLVACLLSLAFGLIAGWCGVGMAKYGRWFAGPPMFLIPWMQLASGLLATLLICLLAAIVPAIRAGAVEPLTLLRVGSGAR